MDMMVTTKYPINQQGSVGYSNLVVLRWTDLAKTACSIFIGFCAHPFCKKL